MTGESLSESIQPMNQEPAFCARRGNGRLQWNAESWFGGVVGGTSWFAFGAVALLWKGEWFASAISATAWLVVLALACYFWTRRDRVSPFQAIACVLLFLTLVMPIVWLICWDVPIGEQVASLSWIRGTRTAAACLIAPLILLCFAIQEWSGSRERRPSIDRIHTDE